MSTAEHAPDSPAGPWSMPAKFLPLPKGFSCAGNSTKIDLRSKTHSQLLAVASRHNSRQGIREDPFQTALKGIPERAKLRPDSKEATTHTLGTVAADSPYARAWRSIKRKQARGTSNKNKLTEEAAAKRAEAATAAARLAKLQGKSVQDLGVTRKQVQQQLEIPPEQIRWRSKLEAFLGRPVVLPRLAPDAPVLDMNKLFLEVMNLGGMQEVTAADGWASIAFQLQRDAALADAVFAVYDTYLHPLEKDLPCGFRPARNIDHLEGRALVRSGMGSRLATYDAVVYAWQHAVQAIEALMPGAGQHHAQLQEQHLSVSSSKSSSTMTHATLLLLREAAVQPLYVVQQLQQHSIAPGLHGPSREACIAQRRRAFASRRKARVVAAVEVSEWGAEEEHAAAEKFKAEDASIVELMETSANTAKLHERQKPSPSSPALEQGQGASNSEAKAAAANVGEEAPADSCVKLGLASGNSESTAVDAASGIGEQQQHCQQHPSLVTSAQVEMRSARQLLHAVQWFLLSRRAVLSGPPGCDKPALHLPGVVGEGASSARGVGGNGARTSVDGKHPRVPGISSHGKRAFQGFTPKCGSCKTCLMPSLKKACIVNRVRIAQGLAPLLPAQDKGNAGADIAQQPSVMNDSGVNSKSS